MIALLKVEGADTQFPFAGYGDLNLTELGRWVNGGCNLSYCA